MMHQQNRAPCCALAVCRGQKGRPCACISRKLACGLVLPEASRRAHMARPDTWMTPKTNNVMWLQSG